MKAGTTSLFNYIACHPAFRGPITKEIDYFNFNSHLPAAWYFAHFPEALADGQSHFTGEASTGYLPNPRAASRVKRLMPDVKIIVMLRDSVDRSLSHYFHEVRAGRERRRLADAIRAPEADAGYSLSADEEYPFYRGLLGAPFVRRSDAALVAAKPMHFGYVFTSRYAEQLRSWFANFGPQQLLVVNSDSFFSAPHQGMARIFEFLEVDARPWHGEPIIYNKGKLGTNSTDDRRYLETALAESDKALSSVLSTNQYDCLGGVDQFRERRRVGNG